MTDRCRMCADCGHRRSEHREHSGVCGPCSLAPTPPYPCGVMFYILPADHVVAEAIRHEEADPDTGHVFQGNADYVDSSETMPVYLVFAAGKETVGSLADRLVTDLELAPGDGYALYAPSDSYGVGQKVLCESPLERVGELFFLGPSDLAYSTLGV